MRRCLRAVLVVFLTAGLLAIFLRDASFSRVWEVTRHARLDLLGAALMLTVAATLLRIERWRGMLALIGGASFAAAGRATVIGFAANALVPGRVGEILRPYLAATRAGLSPASAAGTIVLERFFDLLAIGLSVAVVLVAFAPPVADARVLGVVRTGLLMAGAASVLAGIGIVWLNRRTDAVSRGMRRLESAASGRFGRSASVLLRRFIDGLAIVRRPGQVAWMMAASLLLWTCIAASVWVTTLAYGIAIPFSGGMLLTGLVAIGVSIPTPAGVGGYHAAYEMGATALYGAQTDRAVAAAFATHFMAFGPITLLGLVLMAQEGLRMAQLAAFRRDRSLAAPAVRSARSAPAGGGSAPIDPARSVVPEGGGSPR